MAAGRARHGSILRAARVTGEVAVLVDQTPHQIGLRGGRTVVGGRAAGYIFAQSGGGQQGLRYIGGVSATL